VVVPLGAGAENVLLHVGTLRRPGRLRAEQLEIERDRDPASDLVLQCNQIRGAAVEPLGPQMRVGCGIDQLGINSYMVADR